MQLSAVSGSTMGNSAGNQVGKLGQEEFLKLLLAQLRNQDPLKPMDDTQFIAQLAQFSMLEKLQQLDDRIALMLQVEQLGQASALIGKEVEALGANAGEVVKGKVESVRMLGANAVLMVGGKTIYLDDVISVTEVEANDDDSPTDPAHGASRPP